MDWKRLSVLAGGAAAFVAVVAVGALAIVGLSPDDPRTFAAAPQGLLIENSAPPRPFDLRATPRQSEDAITALREPGPARTELPPASVTEPEPRTQTANVPSRPVEPMTKSVPATRVPRREAALENPPSVAYLPKAEEKPPRPSRPTVQAALPSTQPRPDGVLTPGEIRRMRLSLRLTREQEPYWPPLEQALLEISAQQQAMVRAGHDPKDAFGIGAGMRIYSVARPFLDQLREDQKAQVRARARAMGFGAVASSI